MGFTERVCYSRCNSTFQLLHTTGLAASERQSGLCLAKQGWDIWFDLRLPSLSLFASGPCVHVCLLFARTCIGRWSLRQRPAACDGVMSIDCLCAQARSHT